MMVLSFMLVGVSMITDCKVTLKSRYLRTGRIKNKADAIFLQPRIARWSIGYRFRTSCSDQWSSS